MSPSARGITLIELIVVMAILSVMLAVVGPSVSAGMDNLVLESAGRRVVSAFRAARSSARNTGRRIFAAYDESKLTFARGDQPYQTVDMPRDVRLISSGQMSVFVLLESGQIVGPDAIELVSRRGRRLQLSIDHSTGLVKLGDRK